MLKIGLTGGIASGKSAVADFFERCGATVIDTDCIAREVVAPGESGLELVRQEFGPDVATEEGHLDRSKLRALVFGNREDRHRLEKILHPLIRGRLVARLAALNAAPYVIVAVPLLLETDFHKLVDRILVVDVSVETQLERLMTRDHHSREQAEAMIDAQASRQTRLSHADDIIDNSGSLDSTRAQVEALHRRYLQLATVCREESGRAE